MEREMSNIDQVMQDAYRDQQDEEENFGILNEVPTNGLSEIKVMLEKLSELRRLYKHTSDMLEEIKEEKTQLEASLFIALENAGIQNIKGDDGTTFYKKEQFFASVKIEDKPEFFQWLRDHQMGDIIKEDIHPKTLTAFVKEQMEHENELPKCVSTFTRNTIGYRGGK